MKFVTGILCASLLVILTACSATYRIAKPIYPAPTMAREMVPIMIDTLQPIFRWEPETVGDQTYDLIVYRAIRTESYSRYARRLGEQIYYKEGITGTYHRIEQPLEPETEYAWSVRIRRGDQVTPWAKYDFNINTGVSYASGRNVLPVFRTPSTTIPDLRHEMGK